MIRLKANSIRQNFDSIRFTIATSLGVEAVYELWSALSNVVAKLLTVISLGLAVIMHSDVSTKVKKTFH